ncbi:hypothetical protein Btru_051792 [Bulinus truncatus]|nr:hypothetical protein Btru_051792 [Bulinus truncatus]
MIRQMELVRSWNNEYTNQLNRVKRNKEKYSRNPANFDGYQSSNRNPYNEDCKELNYPFKSNIPWTSWNIVRSWQGNNLHGSSGELRKKFSPLNTERRQGEKVFLCRRRDGQNNVSTYIRRGQADADVWSGRDRLGNDMDWNPYRGEGRSGPYWRAKKETPSSETEGKNGGSARRQKRWTSSNWFPWFTYQNSDWFYNGNNFVMYRRAGRDNESSRQKRWHQPNTWNPYWMYQDARYQPYARNPYRVYQDASYANAYNPFGWNLWPGPMMDMYGRYSRQSSKDNNLNQGRSPA